MMTVEENRKKVRKNNLLMSLLFLVMIIGIGGAIYYYRNLKIAKLKVQEQKQEVETYKDSLKNRNDRLEALVDSIENFKNLLDSISRTTYVSNDFSKIKRSLDNILQPVTGREAARNYAKIGYNKLKVKDLVGAMDAFNKSEKSYNGYRNSYEIYMLLRNNRDKLNDPGMQKQLLEKIQKDYNSLELLNRTDIN